MPAFFVNRFASMRWSILTPDIAIHWDGKRLTEGPGATKADAPDGDPVEAVWKTYYASIFNPARVKVGAMLKEMPRKYWKNMPETALVPGIDRERAGAGERDGGDREGQDVGRQYRRRRGPRCARRRWAARAATSTSTRRRRCSAKGRSTPR